MQQVNLPSFAPYTQFCRWGYRQNHKTKAMKPPEFIRENLHEFRLDKDFLI